MLVAENKVIKIHYSLKNDSGDLLDSSDGTEPLAYIQGSGALLPKLEKTLEGKAVGDSIKVSISPKDGYGEYQDDLVHEVPFEELKHIKDLSVGMVLQTESEEGEEMNLTILEITDSLVKLDGNHPLAGIALNFEVEIIEIRDATKEELDHGHAHDGDGHHHGHH